MLFKGNLETTFYIVKNYYLKEVFNSILKSYFSKTSFLAILSNSITVVSKLK